jgi:hypothetical protein
MTVYSGAMGVAPADLAANHSVERDIAVRRDKLLAYGSAPWEVGKLTLLSHPNGHT